MDTRSVETMDPMEGDRPSGAVEALPAVGISVVVPVVDRSDDLVRLYNEFSEEIRAIDPGYQFLFVFDGAFAPSADLMELARKDDQLGLLRFGQGFGEAACLRAGLDRSVGDLVVTLPSYFQVEPSGIRAVLDALGPGADLVVARRWPRQDGWLNRLQSRIFHSLVRMVAGVRFRDMACGVRAMKRDVAEALPLYGDLHRFIPALAERDGFRVTEVEIPQHPLDGRPRVYRPGVYVRRVLDIFAFFFLAKFTYKPLRFFGLLGAALGGAGVLLGAVLFVERILGTGIANRPLLLLSALLVALGVQLVGLGLVGEIIVHFRAPERRSYRVGETTEG